MAKLSLTDLANLQNEASAVSTINANHALLETALENTLSRDGTSPNTMSADLDMNSNNILNLPYPASSTEPVRLGDIDDLVEDAVADIATGPTGATGNPAGIEFNFSALTTDADNGPGTFWFNNATISSATVVYFDNADYFETNVTAFLDTFDDYNDTNGRGTLYIKDNDNPSVYSAWKVTGSVVDGTGYRKVTVTHLASNGTPAGRSSVTFAPAGNSGSASGDVSASSSFAADNLLIRSDGSAKAVQDSAATLDDSGNLSGIAALSATTIELGASDTTLTRTGAGAIAVEGVAVALNAITLPHTALSLDIGHASDTTLARGAAGKPTIEGAYIKLAGKETIYIPATGMISRVTNGPAAVNVETSTNKNQLRSLDFDTSTQEFAQFAVRMPKSWDEGTITAQFVWTHPSTTTNFGVVWALQAVAYSDNEAGDVAFGTEQIIADTGGATSQIYITGVTPAITIGGTPSAEDWVMFQVKRVPSDGSDTMAVDAKLLGVTLYITTNDANDA